MTLTGDCIIDKKSFRVNFQAQSFGDTTDSWEKRADWTVLVVGIEKVNGFEDDYVGVWSGVAVLRSDFLVFWGWRRDGFWLAGTLGLGAGGSYGG